MAPGIAFRKGSVVTGDTHAPFRSNATTCIPADATVSVGWQVAKRWMKASNDTESRTGPTLEVAHIGTNLLKE